MASGSLLGPARVRSRLANQAFWATNWSPAGKVTHHAWPPPSLAHWDRPAGTIFRRFFGCRVHLERGIQVPHPVSGLSSRYRPVELEPAECDGVCRRTDRQVGLVAVRAVIDLNVKSGSDHFLCIHDFSFTCRFRRRGATYPPPLGRRVGIGAEASFAAGMSSMATPVRCARQNRHILCGIPGPYSSTKVVPVLGSYVDVEAVRPHVAAVSPCGKSFSALNCCRTATQAPKYLLASSPPFRQADDGGPTRTPRSRS